MFYLSPCRWFSVYSRGGYRSTASYGRGGGTYYSARYSQRGGAMSRYAATTRGGRGGGTTTYALRRGARGGSSYIRGRGGLRGGRGGGVSYYRGGRGGYRGGRGRGGANAGPTSKESLDAELDKYMGEDNIKKRLDNDLENYFSRSTGGSSSTTATGGGVEGSSSGSATGTGAASDDSTAARAAMVPNGHIQTTTGAGGRSGRARSLRTFRGAGSRVLCVCCYCMRSRCIEYHT